MAKEKVTIKWSKREKDWISRFPEWDNRNPRILGNNFFHMIQDYKNANGESLRTIIDNAGFDPDTFTIIVHAKKNN